MEASQQAGGDVGAPAPQAPAERPSGPAAAAVLAAGLGAFALAILVVAAEASEGVKDALAYSKAVGPLSGKTLWALGVYLASWVVLAALLRRRQVSLKGVWVVTVVLVALALLGTFSPFFEMFAPSE